MKHRIYLLILTLACLTNTWAQASGPCSAECRFRAATGNRLVAPGKDGQALDLMANINRDNVRKCQEACVNETTGDACWSCAQRAIPAEKKAADRAQLTQFDCPNPPVNGCVLVQQPVFNYNTKAPAPGTMPANAAQCVNACKNRIPYNGMQVANTKLEEAKQLAYNTALPIFTDCVRNCAGKSGADCDTCAAEQINDETRQQMIDQMNAQFQCGSDQSTDVTANIIESIIGAPAPVCPRLSVDFTVQQQ